MEILVTLPLDEAGKARFAAAAPGHQLHFVEKDAVTPALLESAQAILGNLADPGQLRQCKELRWLQLDSAGTDGYCAPGLLPEGAVLTNATGAFGACIAEWLLAALLAIWWHLPEYAENQKNCRWQRLGSVRTLAGSTVLVLGFGDLGRNFARRAHLLGARVLAVRRRPGEKPDWLEGLGGAEMLEEWLPKADAVVLCLPANASTRHMLSAGRIALLKKDAVVLNAGRGSAVDTEALCRALCDGRIGGAALDVTDPEPLPPEHPLWHAPNTILTPHVSGLLSQPENFEKAADICEENLRRFLAGQPLMNQVDRSTGYVD